jgi:hypothetical protein
MQRSSRAWPSEFRQGKGTDVHQWIFICGAFLYWLAGDQRVWFGILEQRKLHDILHRKQLYLPFSIQSLATPVGTISQCLGPFKQMHHTMTAVSFSCLYNLLLIGTLNSGAGSQGIGLFPPTLHWSSLRSLTSDKSTLQLLFFSLSNLPFLK